jgi:hypothetical protein
MTFEFSNKDREIEIHIYNESTGIYTNTAKINIEANTGLPAHSTIAPLPAANANQSCVFKDGNWQVVEDNRGLIWDIATKEPYELKELGEIPAGKTNLQPFEFDKWDGSKWIIDKAAELAFAKKTATTKVQSFATQCRQSIAGNPDHLETAEWSEKRLRAMRVTSSKELPGDREKIETEALYRGQGETIEQLASKILIKSERFEYASIVITGMTVAAIKAINKALSVAEIDDLVTSLESNARTKLAQL